MFQARSGYFLLAGKHESDTARYLLCRGRLIWWSMLTKRESGAGVFGGRLGCGPGSAGVSPYIAG